MNAAAETEKNGHALPGMAMRSLHHHLRRSREQATGGVEGYEKKKRLLAVM